MRERDKERERDGSDVTMVALKLGASIGCQYIFYKDVGDEFCTFP